MVSAPPIFLSIGFIGYNYRIARDIFYRIHLAPYFSHKKNLALI